MNAHRNDVKTVLLCGCALALFLLTFCAVGGKSLAQPFAGGPPRITNQPMSQTVIAGANVTFKVGVAESSTPLTYQWYFSRDGNPYGIINGATDDMYTIVNVQPMHEGHYRVAVTNAFGSVTSSAADLEVIVPARINGQPQSQYAPLCSTVTFQVIAGGTPPFTYQWRRNTNLLSNETSDILILNDVHWSQAGTYKVTVSNSGGTAMSSNATLTLYSAGGASGSYTWVLPLGTGGSLMLDSSNSFNQFGVSTPCGFLSENASWIRLKPEDDGLLIIDTIESSFNTLLGVYHGQNPSNATFVVCDDNGAPDGVRSEVSFGAAHCDDYYVGIDGVGGEQGIVQINWKLGRPPLITLQPLSQTVTQGATVSFHAMASGVPMPDFQWRYNSNNIPGATNMTWTLTNAQPGNAGSYSVLARNLVGSVPSEDATLVVVPPVRLIPLEHSTQGFRFRLEAPPGNYGIQASSNLAGWLQLFIVSPTNGTVEVVDPEGGVLPQRFYRALREVP